MAICNNKKCSLGECDQTECCAAYIPVITNADRIRAMSDEELYIFLGKIKNRANLCKLAGGTNAFKNLCSMEWLQQPAE